MRNESSKRLQVMKTKLCISANENSQTRITVCLRKFHNVLEVFSLTAHLVSFCFFFHEAGEITETRYVMLEKTKLLWGA